MQLARFARAAAANHLRRPIWALADVIAGNDGAQDGGAFLGHRTSLDRAAMLLRHAASGVLLDALRRYLMERMEIDRPYRWFVGLGADVKSLHLFEEP